MFEAQKDKCQKCGQQETCDFMLKPDFVMNMLLGFCTDKETKKSIRFAYVNTPTEDKPYFAYSLTEYLVLSDQEVKQKGPLQKIVSILENLSKDIS